MTRSRKWVAPGLDNLMENPPGAKGDFLRDTEQFSPLTQGGEGGFLYGFRLRKAISYLLR